MKTLLLYAHPLEVKYIINVIPKFCIGYRAIFLEQVKKIPANKIILFGSCGDLGKHDVKIFATNPMDILTVSYQSLKDKNARNYAYQYYNYVDMETKTVREYCEKNNIEFKVYKYVIDRCDRKVMPTGINWLGAGSSIAGCRRNLTN